MTFDGALTREDAPHDAGNGAAGSDDDEAVAEQAGEGSAPRRTRRIAIGALAVVVVAVIAVAVLRRGGGDGSAAASSVATTTVAVERRDLVVTDTYEGSLGYGDARSVTAGVAGVVTTVAPVGSVVAPGEALYAVDLQPTVLLSGTVPAYRALDSSASNGPDVAQLEQALVDLGFGDGITVDDEFDAATAGAVETWETAIGREDPDGAVALGDITFAAGAQRVAEVQADIGTQVQSGSTVLTATSTDKVVTVDIEADQSNQLEVGAQVSLTLPDGAESTGAIADIGTETVAADETDPTAEATVSVTIALDDPSAAESFDSGSVDVALERSRDDGVLAVPVEALLALAEGGYAVEVVDATEASSSRLVAVEVGTYADGYVGIAGVDEGTEVVVPE